MSSRLRTRRDDITEEGIRGILFTLQLILAGIPTPGHSTGTVT